MARHSKDWNEGYQAAIEAIKKAMSGSGGSGGSGGDGSGLPMPDINNQGNQEGNGQNSRTSSSNENQGVVRPEDCGSSNISSALGKVPSTAGGMIDQNVGEQIAKNEGYDPTAGSESAIEREWNEAAIREVNKQRGKLPGSLVSKIEGLLKTSKDWKKDLRKIVGISISPEDKRQAYANKNTLVSQNRIARTDKDKYDNLDYMMAWIDSSGSMSDEQLRQCLSEVYYVALAKKPIKLVVIQCDTKIQDIQEYTNLKDLKKHASTATVKGRGGTELKPCWDLLTTDKKYNRRPAELVMVFTDGYLNQYKRNPRTMKNLCWVILDNPSWTVQYKDINTKVVHINTADIK